MLTISDDTIKSLLTFREERDWAQFHTPRNLASALVVEAAELLECFRWAKDDDLPKLVVEEHAHLEEEIADIAILLTYLCVDLDIDLGAVVREKIRKNGENYPVKLAHGNARKYDQF